jgi:hypothetical protein
LAVLALIITDSQCANVLKVILGLLLPRAPVILSASTKASSDDKAGVGWVEPVPKTGHGAVCVL